MLRGPFLSGPRALMFSLGAAPFVFGAFRFPKGSQGGVGSSGGFYSSSLLIRLSRGGLGVCAPSFFFGESPRKEALCLDYDGFFFPYHTHSGYFFRPLYALKAALAPRGRGTALGFARPLPRLSLERPEAPHHPVRPYPGKGSLSLGWKKRAFSRRLLRCRRLVRGLWRRRLASRGPCSGGLASRLLPLSGKLGVGGGVRAAPLNVPQTRPSWSLEAARFKPGLATEWRRNRLAFNLAWGLDYYRQRRLTRFFLKLRGLGGFSFLQLLALSAGHILRLSFFSPHASSGAEVSTVSPVWGCRLNGSLVVNPFVQLFIGDVLQVFFSSGVAPSPSGLSGQVGSGRQRYRSFFRAQFFTFRSPAARLDVPAFLEVDELSLTSAFIFNPSLRALLPFTQVGPAPYLTFRLYNWKYVT